MTNETTSDTTRYRIAVTLTDEDQGYRFSEWTEDVPDSLLNDDGRPDMGAIYHAAQRDYGRCTSSVYVDNPDNPHRPTQVGWYFVKRDDYGRGEGTYLRGAWVMVVAERPAARSLVAVG